MLITRAFIDYALRPQKGRVSRRGRQRDDCAARQIGAATLLDAPAGREHCCLCTDARRRYPNRHNHAHQAWESRWIEANGGWLVIPTGSSLKPGGNDNWLPVIRGYLAMTGDLDAADRALGDRYDDKAVAAVKKHFQERHGDRGRGGWRHDAGRDAG